MAVNFCSNCGAKLRVGAKFCGSCGQKIQSTEEKLPPMPYEKSKSAMEVYAEKKAAAQVQSESAIKLEKTLPAPQAQPKSVAEVFAEAKANAQTQKPVPKTMVEILAELKANAQGQVAPKHSSPPQAIYTPLNEYTSPYQEDVTIKEKFFSTTGRLNRMRYFKRWLTVDIVMFILVGIVFSICSTPWGDLTSTGNILANLVLAATLVPDYCLNVRRIKDIGKDENFVKGIAGLEVVLALIQIYCLSDWDWDWNSKTPVQQLGMSVSTIRCCIFGWLQKTAGTVGANKYGADPLENERRFNH